MDRECVVSAARYGITLDPSLITGIDPPPEVESALARDQHGLQPGFIRTSASRKRRARIKKIVQSKRAVEIETLKARRPKCSRPLSRWPSS